jgi:predicted transcriptional regulator
MAGALVNPQLWQSVYEDVANTLLAGISANKDSLLEQIKETAKMSFSKKAEAVVKRRSKD